jgi:hypothetical protein
MAKAKSEKLGIVQVIPSREDQIAHLGMIQGVINRLATNASSMKSLAGTIAAAAIALYGTLNNSQWAYLVGASVPIVIFCIMETRYLQLERAYRALYDDVRLGTSVEPFTMSYEPYLPKVSPVVCLLFSWSIMWFYLAIMVAFAIIYIATPLKIVTAGTP